MHGVKITPRIVDAHTKFQVSSFSRSKDIRVRILKIWVLSVVLDLTESEFLKFRYLLEATRR